MKSFSLRKLKLILMSLSLGIFAPTVFATNYNLPSGDSNIIGEIQYVYTDGSQTLGNVAKQYDVGFNQMSDANNGLTRITSGTRLQVPGAHILPPLPRKGIVINLSEMRMYYYPPGSDVVKTYPIGIGKVGKTIPLAQTRIVRKVVNPVWIPPQDIREFNQKQGIELPAMMPAGPDNPLGPYAIYLGVPTYLIHSTIFPESVGRRASFGCIRMHEDDIKDFFPIVTPGTSVAIIDQPTKVGWFNNQLYIEAHSPLEESQQTANHNNVVTLVADAIPKDSATLIDWQMVEYLSKERDGVPHEIGFRAN